MKPIFILFALLLSAMAIHSQTLAYADTIRTPIGDFMLETNEEIIEMSFDQQTQIAGDGGYSEQLNFYPSGARFAALSPDKNISFSITPNPTHDHATISLTNGGLNMTMNITDITGRIISTQTFSSVDGTHLRSVDLSGYGVGIYFIDIQTGDQHLTRKLVKQ